MVSWQEVAFAPAQDDSEPAVTSLEESQQGWRPSRSRSLDRMVRWQEVTPNYWWQVMILARIPAAGACEAHGEPAGALAFAPAQDPDT